MKVLVLSPASTDHIGRLGGQIADRSVRRLRAEGHEVEWIHGADCREDSLRLRRVDPGGSAFFGHGYPDQLEGADGRPLFAGDGAERLRGSWLHAFACDAADEFATRVLRHGATVVVGYKARLHARWAFDGLPAEALEALEAFLTCVTSLLAQGTTDERELRRVLAEALDRLTAAVSDSDADGGLLVFGQGVVRDLVVRRG